MNLDDLEATSTTADGLTRREILAWGSVAAVGSLATPGLSRAAQIAPPSVVVEPMSVGYILGSDLIPSYEHLSWQNAGRAGDGVIEVAPAISIEAESRAYANAHVRVAGLYPHADALGGLRLGLTVLMPTDNGTAQFFPWRVGSGNPRQVSPTVSFHVPLLADGGLELLLEVTDPSTKPRTKGTSGRAGTTRTFGTRFSSRLEKGVPRLRRGFYLLGTQWGMWEQTTLLPPADKPPRLDRVSVVVAVEPIVDPFDP